MFVHPYIDKEIENEGLRERVENLLRDEMEGRRETEIEAPVAFAEAKIDSVDKTEVDEYEDLGREMMLLEALIQSRGDAFRRQIESLERELAGKRREKASLEQALHTVLLERQTQQEGHAERLIRLKEKEEMLRQSNAQLRQAIEAKKSTN